MSNIESQLNYNCLIYNKKKAVLFGNFEAMERFYDIEFFSKNFRGELNSRLEEVE